jgi:hypothetical protein
MKSESAKSQNNTALHAENKNPCLVQGFFMVVTNKYLEARPRVELG